MSTQKEIKIVTKSGMEIKIPRFMVDHIVLPTVVIDNMPFRLNVNMNDYENEISKIRKKLNI